MKEIQKISIVDATVESIKRLIETEEYAIGEQLPSETEFCEILNVSRSSVREAIRVLKALDYVVIKPGRGTFVTDFKAAQLSNNWYDPENAKFSDFMEVRMAIETLSVRLAVERATEKQIKELEDIHELFIKASENQDLVKLIMLDELFHTKIVEFTNNQLLININKQVLETFRTYRSDSFTNKSVYKNATEPHRRILSCFHKSEASQAIKEMRIHLEITAKDMQKIHDERG